MQTIAHEGARVETGAVQFGDDWPGVFIRGDNAFALAMTLQALLDGRDDPLTRAQVGGLLSLLRSSNVHADTRHHTPAADEVEAVARAIADEDDAPWDAKSWQQTPNCETPDELREGYRCLARAAIYSEAVTAIMARCEALEDEAADMNSDCSKVTSFYSGQKFAAKSIRRELHDLTRALGREKA